MRNPRACLVMRGPCRTIRFSLVVAPGSGDQSHKRGQGRCAPQGLTTTVSRCGRVYTTPHAANIRAPPQPSTRARRWQHVLFRRLSPEALGASAAFRAPDARRPQSRQHTIASSADLCDLMHAARYEAHDRPAPSGCPVCGVADAPYKAAGHRRRAAWLQHDRCVCALREAHEASGDSEIDALTCASGSWTDTQRFP